jgi:hypothetical protein
VTASLLTEVSSLIYELLDAHGDTVEMATRMETTCNGVAMLRWQAHIDYLRALQRKGREVLAHFSCEPEDR